MLSFQSPNFSKNPDRILEKKKNIKTLITIKIKIAEIFKFPEGST